MKQRIITGLILGFASIGVTFFLNSFWFGLVLAVFISLAAYEWTQFMRISQPALRLAYVALLWVVTWIAWQYQQQTLLIAGAWWLCALLMVLAPFAAVGWVKQRFILLPMGFLVLVPAWIAMVKLQAESSTLLFYVICLVCFADSGAYFIGSKWGKHKLAPILSPKKTIEGLVGGLVVGGFFGFLVSLFLPITGCEQYIKIYAIGFFVMLIAVMGDLFESLLKRQCQIKDSGSILPGHGGILDRLDSVSVAMPVFALLYGLLF